MVPCKQCPVAIMCVQRAKDLNGAIYLIDECPRIYKFIKVKYISNCLSVDNRKLYEFTKYFAKIGNYRSF